MWGSLSVLGLIAAAAGTYVMLGGPAPHKGPPPPLSQAGGPVANETYQWRHVAVGGGGFITGLSMDPAGKTFVVRTDVYGGYLWDAKGNRWNQLVTAPAMPAIDLGPEPRVSPSKTVSAWSFNAWPSATYIAPNSAAAEASAS